jgi:hypothetical protein
MTPYNKIPGNKVSVTCLPRLFSFGNRCTNSFKSPGFISEQIGLKVNTYIITAAIDEMIMMTKMTIWDSK